MDDKRKKRRVIEKKKLEEGEKGRSRNRKMNGDGRKKLIECIERRRWSILKRIPEKEETQLLIIF